MPRKARGPYLHLREYTDGRASVWIVRGLPGGKEASTTLSADADQQSKADALATIIAKVRDTATAPIKGVSDPNQVIVADCVGYYWPRLLERLRKKASDNKRELGRVKQTEKISTRLLDYFGLLTISEVTADVQEEYTQQRGSNSSARYELTLLAAAINAYSKRRGGLRLMFSPTLPAPSQPREGCLTRQQAAALIRAAWRFQQKNRGGSLGRHTKRHVARAIIVGLYTGTRAAAICNAAPMRAIGRGWVDLETGVYWRKAHGSAATNKKQPTVPLMPRLLAHMRRWHRLGISTKAIIECRGKPIKNFYRGFVGARDLAGLGVDIMPHTLRHTCISWMLRAGISKDDVSEYCGVSVQILDKHYKHYMEGAFDRVIQAGQQLGRTRRQA
jgi:integrase